MKEEQDTSQERICLELPATLQYLHVLSACLAAVLMDMAGVEESTSYNVQLAVHEICTNIVLYAYAGQSKRGRIQVMIVIDRDKKGLTVTVCDDGVPFDEACVKEPVLGSEQVHGYGLFLVRKLMDGVDYRRLAGKNCWRLKKYLVRS
ncbi:MAG TPA: ATP-binding protein [Ktedonobacteraceae bacterium]|jgi:serine/threonine-protein kinase RsbW|nr:ATP-binding protein [Ktedonobacteraceae bacterium]